MKPLVLFALCLFVLPTLQAQKPKLQPFDYTPENLQPIFDDFWTIMNEKYSYFHLKANVDWAKLKAEHRTKVLAAQTEPDFVKALQKMLQPLDDIHIFIVNSKGERTETGSRSWNYNGNLEVVRSHLEDTFECEKYAIVGSTITDGFGYFLMLNQGSATKASVADAASAIRDLKDAPGFIVDLRRSNGGSEPLAMEIAKLFCDTPVVYATSKYRNGPGHTDFGPPIKRTLMPCPPGEAFTKPVVCLIGPGCISSGEGFAKMMKALPNVSLVGLPTAGASGNPKPITLGRTGVTVYYSSWVDMLPDGTVIEGKGVPPTIEVKEKAEAYRDADPTLEKAFEVLKKAVKK